MIFVSFFFLRYDDNYDDPSRDVKPIKNYLTIGFFKGFGMRRSRFLLLVLNLCLCDASYHLPILSTTTKNGINVMRVFSYWNLFVDLGFLLLV